MASFSDGVMFLEWTENNGNLSGTIQSAEYKSATRFDVDTATAGFTGIRADGRITLTIPVGLGFATTISGTVDGPNLTLFMPNRQGVMTPYIFHLATLTDYNRAVDEFKRDGEVRSAQSRAATATSIALGQSATATSVVLGQSASATAAVRNKQQAAVRDANMSLADALRQLSASSKAAKGGINFESVLRSYSTDWTQMQAEYRKLQEEAAKKPLDCYQLAVVKYQLDTIRYAHDTIKYDRDSFNYTANQVRDNIAAVQRDIQAVQRGWATLQNAVAANTTGSPTPQFTQGDIDRAIADAQPQVESLSKILQAAETQATDYDTKAARLEKDARDFVASLKCT